MLGLLTDRFEQAANYGDHFRKYLRGESPPRSDRATSTVSGLSPNVAKILTIAGHMSQQAGRSQVGVEALILATLQSESRRISETVAALGQPRERLLSDLGQRLLDSIRSQPASDGGGAAATVRESAASASQTRPRHLVSRYETDNPGASADDYLDIAKEVRAFAYLAADKTIEPPLSVGVFGEWGSGKTFFMERMHDCLNDIMAPTGPYQKTNRFHKDVVQIRFNAWHYIETNLWASLVEYIFQELDRWLRDRGEDNKKINALFEKLATSKQLRLEAVEELIAARKGLKKAETEVAKARSEYDAAIQERSAVSRSDVFAAAAQHFVKMSEQQGVRQKLDSAIADLGISHIQKSASDVAQLVSDSRQQGVRAKLLVQSLLERARSWPVMLGAAGLVLGTPLVLEGLRLALAAITDAAFFKDFNTGILAFSSIVAAAIVTGRELLGRGIAALDAIDQFRASLDQQIASKTEEERKRLEEADKKVLSQQHAVADAERRLNAAADQAIVAETNFASDTARGRLNKFIRDRVADGSYAKHLGIVATIRKDFAQLADIMQNKTPERGQSDVDAIHALYKSKLEALLAAHDNSNAHLIDDEEVVALTKEPTREELRVFNRIVLYIDDLDRCPPKKVAEVLQAIHMLLYFPLFVVVVAVDARWVARSLETEFPHLLRSASKDHDGYPDTSRDDETPTDRVRQNSGEIIPRDATATAQDYLEKIFQLPFWIRRMDSESSKTFVSGLTRKTVQAKNTPPSPASVAGSSPQPDNPPGVGPEGINPSGLASPTSPTPVRSITPVVSETLQIEPLSLEPDEARVLAEFAPFVGGSPRRAKRFVNLYHLLRTSLDGVPASTTDAKVRQRALILALAIATGAPYSASIFFDALAPVDKRYVGLSDLAEGLGASPAASGPDGNIRDAVKLLMKLNDESGVTTGPDMTRELHLLAPTVRRYSFELII